MKDRQIEKMIGAYGANPARWPKEKKPGEGEILLPCTEAGAISAEARRVDRALDSLPRPARAGSDLRAAILAIPARRPQSAPATTWLRRLLPFGAVLGGPLPQLGGLIVACLLGLVMGYSDLLINPWDRTDLTEMALGLDTPQALVSLEGGAQR